jgi:hypothetical protein
MKIKTQLFFDHLAKTGGTTVYEVLKNTLGERAVTEQLSSDHRDLLAKYGWKKLISSHTTFSPYDIFDPNRYYFTILREPLDRALSNYWFARGLSNLTSAQPDSDISLAKEYSFQELLFSEDQNKLRFLSNVYSKHFAKLSSLESTGFNENELFNQAKLALDKFDLVGITEQLEDFFLVLGAETGVQMGKHIPNCNVTNSRKSLTEISLQEKRQLEKLNAVDIELYNYAQNLFQQHRRRALRTASDRLVLSHFDDLNKRELVKSEFVDLLSPVETGGDIARIDSIFIKSQLTETELLYSGEVAIIFVKYHSNLDVHAVMLQLDIHNDAGQKVFGTSSKWLNYSIPTETGKTYIAEFTFRNDLAPGVYYISVMLLDGNEKLLHKKLFTVKFTVGPAVSYNFEGAFNLNPDFCVMCENKQVSDYGENLKPLVRKLGNLTPPLTCFNAEIQSFVKHLQMAPNELISIEIVLTNKSSEVWQANGSRPVQIGNRFFRSNKTALGIEGVRTKLPRNIGPGESLKFFANVCAPSEAGSYMLRICVVQEFVAWFDQYDTGYCDIGITVKSSD